MSSSLMISLLKVRLSPLLRNLASTFFGADMNFSLAVLADIALEPNEECQSIAVVSVGGTNKYIVGTGYVLPSEAEPTKGRLLLYSETSARTFEESSARVVFGCAYALAPLTDNFFGVAVNSQVSPFQFLFILCSN